MNPLLRSGWEFGRRTTPETWSNATPDSGDVAARPGNIGGVGGVVRPWETRQDGLPSTFLHSLTLEPPETATRCAAFSFGFLGARVVVAQLLGSVSCVRVWLLRSF